MQGFNPCFIIPVYNHELSISTTIEKLKPFKMDCLLIDDGSSQNCKDVLSLIDKMETWVILYSRNSNGGKGAAIKDGFKEAFKRGYSHALQIDADGQHNTDDIPLFLREAEKNPGDVICGLPVFDESIPRLRLLSRYLTHIWVWINTLSFEIKDSMCGFRVYPVNTVISILSRYRVGDRMDFDTEILVKLLWSGVRIRQLPTLVHYPADGISHFRLILDNILISAMHARLFFGMLIRLPVMIRRHFK